MNISEMNLVDIQKEICRMIADGELTMDELLAVTNRKEYVFEGLELLETTSYNRRFRMKSGNFQFGTSITKNDWEHLQLWDCIKEPSEKGMTRYINMCSECGDKFLGATMILVPYTCDSCSLDYYRKF